MELDDMSDYDKALDAYQQTIKTGDETKIHAAWPPRATGSTGRPAADEKPARKDNLMTIYYIPIEPEGAGKLHNLLNGLRPFADLAVEYAIRVETTDPAVEPLLRNLAEHTRWQQPAEQPEAEPEPKACPRCGKPNKTGRLCRKCAKAEKEKQAAPKNGSTRYTVVATGEQLTSSELARRLRKREFEIGTRLTSTREPGELVVVAGVRGHELHNLATQAGVEV